MRTELNNIISNAIYGYGCAVEDHAGVVDAIEKAVRPYVAKQPAPAVRQQVDGLVAVLLKIRRGETQVFDDDMGFYVCVSVDAEEMQEIARTALAALAQQTDSERDAALPSLTLSRAGYDVWAERERQITVEGWMPEGDDAYTECQLSRAAACYALHNQPVGNIGDYLQFWPWTIEWWKATDQRRNLVKAGSLIIAEIERIDRAAMAAQQGEKGVV